MSDPHTGAEHLIAARAFAAQAAAAHRDGDLTSAQILAQIGSIHAAVAHAAAAALPIVVATCGDSWETVEWARAIGFIRDHPDDPPAAVPGDGPGLRVVG